MKKLLLGLLCVLACMVFASQARACTLATPGVVIDAPIDTTLFSQDKTCLDDSCTFVFEMDSSGIWAIVNSNIESDYRRIAILNKDQLYISRDFFEPFDIRITNILNSNEFFSSLDRVVEGDLSTFKQTFFSQITQWLATSPDAIGDYNLYIREFNAERKESLLSGGKKLTLCRHTIVMDNGQWMLERPIVRSYCPVAYEKEITCPTIQLSPVRFIVYALNHFSTDTAPYLFGLCIGVAIVIGIAWGLIWSMRHVRQVKKIFAPIKQKTKPKKKQKM